MKRGFEDINLEYYRTFYFVAKTGSITGAARELFISQPAVSQSIKSLEDKLGGRLFFRNSKGIRLTAEGEVLYKYIEQAYNFILTAENRFSELQSLLDGEIRIGAGDTLSRHFLLPHLKRFHSEYPGIRIKVTNRTTPETIDLLRQGRVDMGVVNLPLEDDKDLEIRETIALHDCFIAGESFKHLSNEAIFLNDLGKYPILLLEKGSSTRAFIDRFFRDHNVEITPEIELGSIDLLIEFARIGLGISLAVRDFIEDELRSGSLYEIRLKESIPERRVGLVTLKDVPLSSAAKAFLAMQITGSDNRGSDKEGQ